jgi:hypothetical protein
MRFNVLTAASIKITVCWHNVPCSLIEVDRRFPDGGVSKRL